MIETYVCVLRYSHCRYWPTCAVQRVLLPHYPHARPSRDLSEFDPMAGLCEACLKRTGGPKIDGFLCRLSGRQRKAIFIEFLCSLHARAECDVQPHAQGTVLKSHSGKHTPNNEGVCSRESLLCKGMAGKTVWPSTQR